MMNTSEVFEILQDSARKTTDTRFFSILFVHPWRHWDKKTLQRSKRDICFPQSLFLQWFFAVHRYSAYSDIW